MNESTLTRKQCRRLFTYKEGKLFNKCKRKTALVGQVIGHLTSKGYLRCRVEGRDYLVHRLVYLMHHGYFPVELDHINGVRDDNRIENLRPATRSDNLCNRGMYSNNTSGVKGVTWDKRSNQWQARIHYQKRSYSLGMFVDLELAELVVSEAKDYLHKEFANHGKE